MCMNVLSACIYVHLMHAVSMMARRGPRSLPEPALQAVVSCHCRCGNKTQFLWKGSKTS